MAEKMIRWGMIGCGNVTEKKSAPAFSKIPGSRLVAVGSRTPGRAEDYARRHGVPEWHKDPYEVIRNPGVDIVYIATPPGSHLEYALEAISAGKPVYIEKPMARTWQECLVINDMADKKNVPVYVAYYRRALEYFNRVKEIIDSGSLGRTLAIHIQQYFPARPEDYNRVDPPWRVVPEISGGGYFHDVGCHALDILFYLFGDPVSVMGTRINVAGIYQAEDTVSAILRLPGEVVATAGWSFIVPEACHKDLVEVTGEKGRIRFSIFSFRPISLQMGNLTEAFPVVQPEHIQMPLIRSIVRALNGEGTCPSTGTTAAVTSRVMDEILGRQ
ncbi:MAG: gfo/Idh/MocA family oxidoreductase [Bacteroidetes bacterium]|nr:MAG: gfo/Idh/MocA family oxidoreductase [Bacteroidota bacterium]